MTSQIIEELFGSFDFSLLNSPDFKEDSVREELILPILHSLNYSSSGLNQIIRSKTLHHPFVNIGSKRREIYIIPDYLLLVENKPAWILDAKAPSETITSGENVEQAYSYAIHPDVRTNYYALCNGSEFVLFNISSREPILHFYLSEIEKFWQQLYSNLSPVAFIATSESASSRLSEKQDYYDFSKIRPISEIKDLRNKPQKGTLEYIHILQNRYGMSSKKFKSIYTTWRHSVRPIRWKRCYAFRIFSIRTKSLYK
jgi:hypothetical protein